MPGPRDYTDATRSGLIALSGGTCYWPGCSEPIIRMVDGQPVHNFQIAHIRAAKPGGYRYDASMTDDERRSFANLLLLCTPHHTVVDNIRANEFPVHMLEKWKNRRETGHREALAQLHEVTPQSLQRTITAALEERDNKVHGVLDRLEHTDREAAELLRSLISELSQLRDTQSILSSGTVEELNLAAGTLETVLGSEGVEQLYLSSSMLSEVFPQGSIGYLAEIVEQLNNAAENIRSLPRVTEY